MRQRPCEHSALSVHGGNDFSRCVPTPICRNHPTARALNEATTCGQIVGTTLADPVRQVIVGLVCLVYLGGGRGG